MRTGRPQPPSPGSSPPFAIDSRVRPAALCIWALIVPAAALIAWSARSRADQPAAAPSSFQAAFTDWKNAMVELETLRHEYPYADEAEKARLDQQYGERLRAGRALGERALAAAEAAYAAAPGADPAVSDFLLGALGICLQRDNYEVALRLANLLMPHAGKQDLHNSAAAAAFCTNDYEAAKRHLAAADARGESDAYLQEIFKTQDTKLIQLAADQQAKLWAEEKALRETEALADNLPRIKLATTKGDIVVELFEDQAPNTVANFITLAEKGAFDNMVFHRVIGRFVAQAGSPEGPNHGPGYTIACECYRPDRRNHFRGSLAMALSGRDTGGEAFYLTYVPASELNGRHTVFGRIIEGIDVLTWLHRQVDAPTQITDRVLKATVLRKRDHAYTVQKNQSSYPPADTAPSGEGTQQAVAGERTTEPAGEGTLS